MLSVIAALAMLQSEEVDAATSGTCGDHLTWSLNYRGNLSISGSGEMYDYGQGGAPWYSVRDSITSLSVNGAENIGKQAFYGCTKITSANLGDISSVGVKSFANCTALKTVDFDDSLVSVGAYAFYKCSNLAKIDFEGPAKTLRSIGSYAFYKCTNLSEVCIPSFLSTIGSKAFSMTFADLYGNPLKTDPSVLCGFRYGNVNGILVRQPNVEAGTIFQSEGLTYKVTSSIPAEASVTGYTGVLKKLVVPKERTLGAYKFNITEIANGAFKECKTLREAKLGSVVKIGSSAFYGCTALGNVDLDYTASIGTKAFAKCYALSTVDFGSSLKTIGKYAFYKDYALGSISLPNTSTTVGSKAFYKCYALDSVSLGNSLKNINSYAFAYCENLESIGFPASLKTVGSKAFLGLSLSDCNGKTISATADALRGKNFTGSQGKLSTDMFTVTVISQPSEYGQVSISSFMAKYGTSITISGDKLTVGNSIAYAKPSVAHGGYTYRFEKMEVTAGDKSKVLMDTVITAYFCRDVTVSFKVASDSIGHGTVSSPDSFVVKEGTRVVMKGGYPANTVSLGTYGSNVATPSAGTSAYMYSFVKWTGADDFTTPVPASISGPTTIWAHFSATPIPCSVVIKYICDGYPILKDGLDVSVSLQGKIGEYFEYYYMDNPQFDSTVASKYTLLRGYLERPSDPTDQGGYVSTILNSEVTVIVFEFSKKSTYVQLHRQNRTAADPTYETDEAYGATHIATIQASGTLDAGKSIQVLITDDVSGSAAAGTFIGAGQSATYNGYSYSVNQLPKVVKDGLTYDAVEVVISGGLNVHGDVYDPLVVWYRIVDTSGYYPVVIKYLYNGEPILKNGVDIKVNSVGRYGEVISYSYLDNPMFDENMASEYSLARSYLEKPFNPLNLGSTVTTTIASDETVVVFDFSEKGAYVQFHRQSNPVANPVYETPEPYGDAHHATVAANEPTDAGKSIKILITDNVVGYEAQGTFIGAGQSATYGGYTYSVNQLPKVIKDGLTYDAVEVVIAGGLNVHDDINDPLVIWYQII